MRLLNFILLFLFVIGCSSSPDVIKSDSYKFTYIPDDWDDIDEDKADYAYKSPGGETIFVSNSVCKRYESTPLKNLKTNLISGFDNLKTISEEETSLQGRKSLRTIATAEIDGVKTHLIIETVRKHECIYDFILIGTQKHFFDRYRNEYEKILLGTKIQ
ncbi:MAG: hypothetical protein ACPGJV_07195 [Bacteriovoracaceae bacterium]